MLDEEKKELKKFNAQKIIKNLKKLLLKYFHNLKNIENKINKIEDSVIKMSGIAGPEIIEIGTRYIKTEKKNDKLLIALLVSFNI
jgi:Mg2+ and Co2+ transporter CorA